jgi:hypothetical protein
LLLYLGELLSGEGREVDYLVGLLAGGHAEIRGDDAEKGKILVWPLGEDMFVVLRRSLLRLMELESSC